MLLWIDWLKDLILFDKEICYLMFNKKILDGNILGYDDRKENK